MLIVLINKASKLSNYFLTLDKEYIAVIKLGIKTDTRDISGKILETRKVEKLNEKKVKDILEGFEGRQEQVPPMYSAIKFKGKPLYKIARAGGEVKIKKRTINISNIQFISMEGDLLNISVRCSSGTYIRSLAHDIGLVLGTGGTLQKLNRTRIGNFFLKDSIEVQVLVKEKPAGRLPWKQAYIIPTEEALGESHDVYIKDGFIKLIQNGQPLAGKMIDEEKSLLPDSLQEGDFMMIRDMEGRLLAIHKFLCGERKTAEIDRENKKNISKSIVIF